VKHFSNNGLVAKKGLAESFCETCSEKKCLLVSKTEYLQFHFAQHYAKSSLFKQVFFSTKNISV
jgi:hypothetical protein